MLSNRMMSADALAASLAASRSSTSTSTFFPKE